MTSARRCTPRLNGFICKALFALGVPQPRVIERSRSSQASRPRRPLHLDGRKCGFESRRTRSLPRLANRARASYCPGLSSLHAASGDDSSLVDLDQLAKVADAPLPANQYPSEPVVPNENSFDVRLRLELPPLGGQFRHGSIESCFPYLSTDRRLADNWCVTDFLYHAHNGSFSRFDLRLKSSEHERSGASDCAPIGRVVKYACR